jgi:hypothetical protein
MVVHGAEESQLKGPIDLLAPYTFGASDWRATTRLSLSPRQTDCLLTALYCESTEWMRFGMHGGLTPNERAKLWKILDKPPAWAQTAKESSAKRSKMTVTSAA